ncbi:hypothetical protein C3L33_00417, partial [Rhododendron williamsianum]
MTASIRNVDKVTDESTVKTPENHEESPTEEKKQDSAMTPEAQATPTEEEKQDLEIADILSERRRALFEPLEPVNNVNGKRPSAENLLPPPDFDSASYPRGWLIGKKRKLVNVDVDREIDGLNEQLEEDARCLEHLQLQLLEERSKRTDVERENGMLQNQIAMLMNMLQESEAMDDECATEP